MNDILSQITEYKKLEIAKAKHSHPWEDVAARAKEASPPRGFMAALRERQKQGEFGLIAEVKKASPSKGLIREVFNPLEISQSYEKAGAACLSVLTDTPSFQGKPEFLVEARNATNLPVLRKDFMLETYQVVEARAWGADCILVILAAVDDDVARYLLDAAAEWGMDTLVEVHDRAELDRALSLNATMIGINNRNLRTFETSLNTSVELAAGLDESKLIISESGICDHNDLQMLKTKAGITTVLVGESLMRHDDVGRATKNLLFGENLQ
ncbi:MAG: indole-3-glycerol phosphate synthase TrpC [Devosiaceae bacterium]|nr:indole-3-glycerol phosphate synthase TrpC [Devosiaceae bacterium]